MKTYKGRFIPKNKDKYIGDVDNIVYRSLWERSVFKYLDTHTSVVNWSSEEIVIPYLCPTDKKTHRYFPDVWFRTNTNTEHLIEIKPHVQTQKPDFSNKKRHTKRMLNEVLTYSKNCAKWNAAHEFCENQHHKTIKFSIWTEETLKQLGIKITR